MKKQLAFILARANVPLGPHSRHYGAESDEGDEWERPPMSSARRLAQCLGNHNLSTHFRKFGRAVGVEAPYPRGHLQDAARVPLDRRPLQLGS
jgi:26S proteasome regulatory subunit N1